MEKKAIKENKDNQKKLEYYEENEDSPLNEKVEESSELEYFTE